MHPKSGEYLAAGLFHATAEYGATAEYDATREYDATAEYDVAAEYDPNPEERILWILPEGILTKYDLWSGNYILHLL